MKARRGKSLQGKFPGPYKKYSDKMRRHHARFKDRAVVEHVKFKNSYGRTYYLFDDKRKIYVRNDYMKINGPIGTHWYTREIERAGEFDVNGVQRIMKQIKFTGAWRPIRVK